MSNEYILREEYEAVDLETLDTVVDRMKFMESKKMADFWEKEYTYNYLELMLNTVLCLKIRKQDFKWTEYLELKKVVKKVIDRVPSKS